MHDVITLGTSFQYHSSVTHQYIFLKYISGGTILIYIFRVKYLQHYFSWICMVENPDLIYNLVYWRNFHHAYYSGYVWYKMRNMLQHHYGSFNRQNIINMPVFVNLYTRKFHSDTNCMPPAHIWYLLNTIYFVANFITLHHTEICKIWVNNP